MRRDDSRDDAPVPVADVLPMSAFTTRPVTWRWYPWLPAGKVISIDGPPGLGKSHLTLGIAANLTTGRSLPNDTARRPCAVMILSAEDGPDDTIRPRLEAAGADLDRVYFWRGVHVGDAYRLPTLPQDLHLLRAIVDEHEVRYIAIDPLVAYLDPAVNSHRDHDIRRALAPLADLANETGAAVSIVRHLRKARDGDAVNAGGGSIGIIGAARGGLLVAKDPDDPARRILAHVKNNLGPLAPSLSFELVAAGNGWQRIAWLGGSTHSADALVAVGLGAEDRGPLEEAKAVLAEWLADGPQPKKELLRRAKGMGIAERTLERAKGALGVTHHKHGFGAVSYVEWKLPYSPSSPDTPLNGKSGAYGERESTQVVVVEEDSNTRQGVGEYGKGGSYSPPRHSMGDQASMASMADYEAQERFAIEGEAAA